MQVAMQIALLERQTLPQLRGMWQKYFDTPPISQNKEFYISRLATEYRSWHTVDFQITNSNL